MHVRMQTQTALQLPEILSKILSYCTSDSLTRAARVCRDWERVANTILWRNVTNLWTLLQLLAPMEDTHKGLMLLRPHSDLNWKRFMHHADRVRELDCDFGSKGQRVIAADTFTVLATMRPRLELLPNLERLVWVVIDDVHFAFARLFMHSRLKKLHLVVLPEASTFALRDFLEGLPRTCPELFEIDLSVGVTISALEPTLTNMLAELPLLEVVSLPVFGITTNVLRTLATHKHLKRLHARPFWGPGFYGDANDVRALDVSALQAGSFPALEELDLDSSLPTLHAALAASCFPHSLTHLYISCFERAPLSDLTALLDLIADEMPALSFLGIALLVKPPPQPGFLFGNTDDAAITAAAHLPLPRITLSALRPALRLRKLHSFHIMHNRALDLCESDIEEMGAAWGGPDGCMRSLRLAPDPMFVPSTPVPLVDLGGGPVVVGTVHLGTITDAGGIGTPTTPVHDDTVTVNTIASSNTATFDAGLPLKTLETFARCFPHLTRLEVYLDAASRTAPDHNPTHTLRELTTLDVGISPICGAYTGDVARWLARVAPRRGLEIVFGKDWCIGWAQMSFAAELEHLMPRRDMWQRVGEMHTQLCIMAEEMERQVKRLEEQLRVLTTLRDAMM